MNETRLTDRTFCHYVRLARCLPYPTRATAGARTAFALGALLCALLVAGCEPGDQPLTVKQFEQYKQEQAERLQGLDRQIASVDTAAKVSDQRAEREREQITKDLNDERTARNKDKRLVDGEIAKLSGFDGTLDPKLDQLTTTHGKLKSDLDNLETHVAKTNASMESDIAEMGESLYQFSNSFRMEMRQVRGSFDELISILSRHYVRLSHAVGQSHILVNQDIESFQRLSREFAAKATELSVISEEVLQKSSDVLTQLGEAENQIAVELNKLTTEGGGP